MSSTPYLPNNSLSAFSTIHHELHRIRRGALNRYFSKAAIAKLEPLIHNLADRLCNKLLARKGDGKPIEITMAYSCLTTDIISSYAFGQAEGFLDQPDFTPNLRATILATAGPTAYVRQLPFLFYLIASIPEYVLSLESDWRVC
jgi:cytochrome P450